MRMLRMKAGLILIISLLILFSANSVFAGFGVSPPKILNYHLLPGSHFEQTIYLVQSKPEKDLLAKIEIDAPEIKDWISIEGGLEFTIPAGVQMFPLKVSVDVPSKAAFKSYSGKIWIKTASKAEEGGTVSVALGALISIDLAVSAEEVYGFIFRGLEILKAEEGRPIKVKISLQNTGNTRDRPTKIHLDVYDRYHDKVLYSGDAADLNYIKPFTQGEVVGKFRAKLGIETYWAEVKVYKEDNILIEDKRVFQVVKRTGLLHKIFSKWYSWMILVIIILAAIAYKRKQELKLLRTWLRKQKTRLLEKIKNRLERKLRKLKGK